MAIPDLVHLAKQAPVGFVADYHGLSSKYFRSQAVLHMLAPAPHGTCHHSTIAVPVCFGVALNLISKVYVNVGPVVLVGIFNRRFLESRLRRPSSSG